VSRRCRGGVEAVSRSVEKCRGSVEVVSIDTGVNGVDPCRTVSEGGLTVYMRGACHSVDSVERRSVERVGVCQACRACRVCQVLTRHAPKRECRVAPGDFAGHAARWAIGDAGQAGDCVKQFQYVRVFEHCRVACVGRPGALVAGARTRSLTRFFLPIFKFRSQKASSASGNESQQRKKAVKERRGCEITRCKFLKMYFK
jgi:hypothetical protein